MALGSQPASAAPTGPAPRGAVAVAGAPGSSTTQRPGGSSAYDIAVSCTLPVGTACGPDATVTVPVPPALRTWTFRATSTTAGLLTGQDLTPTSSHGTTAVPIPLAGQAFVGGTSAVVRFVVTSPKTSTATAVRWSVRPTLAGAALGTITAATAVDGSLVPERSRQTPPSTPLPSTPRPAAPAADPAQSALVTIDPADQTHATGTPQTYTINLSCQGTNDARCGPNSTVTIPLDTTTTPPMTDGWTYNAVSNPGGLLVGNVTVVNGQLVMKIDDSIFVGGFSGSITLQVTPPNNITPNDTSWSLEPTLTGDNITTVTAPDPAASVATATPQPSVSKVTTDGGSVYEAGSTVGYTVTARCTAAGSGNLYLSKGSLVDQLPPGVTFVSATNGGSYDAATNSITWTFPDGASTPAGCGDGSTGPTDFGVVVTAPTPAPPSARQPLTNKVTFSGTGPDATDPAGITKTTSAQVPVEIVDQPPTGPGIGYASIAKTSLAPIPQAGVSGNQYVATYPGDWLPSSTTPGYTVGAAAASFRTTISYGLTGHYQTDVIDPVPCLDDASGNEYSSAAYTGSPCADPAFHTRTIAVYSPGFDAPNNGLGAALAAGWRPVAVLTDGSRVTLSPTGRPGTSATSAYFSIPAADVLRVAAIDVPPSPALENHILQLAMWGYADASLGDRNQGVNKLTNVATAIPRLNGTALTPVQARASIYTIPPRPQLGISKSFGAPGAGPNGSTVLTINGSVNLPDVPLTHDVVLTDLLPLGLTWTNPVTSTSATLKQGAGAATTTVSATVQNLRNYQGSGRELIRLRVPATAFTTAGAWTITPPANLLALTTPKALGVYPNTDQIFLFDLGTEPLVPQCSTPTQVNGGTSTAVFESADPQDLAGDGNNSEQYCQNSASLQITGNGAAFSLVKTVRGDQDTVAKGAGGIGVASHGGYGTYGLRWNNVGSDTLDNAVIYDVLPHVGDTGVSKGQASAKRDSRFQPVFDSVGALPAGVTVQYSQSTNPCRNEVYPDASNTGCVSDWTSTEPDPATVRALRFESSDTYASGDGFSVSIKVDVPSDAVNKVAWNSAATNAADITNPGNHPLPAEPPKVGLVAPSTPTLATVTSDAATTAYGQVSDTVTIAGTGGAPGSLAWSLVGPVAPVNGSCGTVDWSGAPVAASGTVAVTGDGDVTTGPASLKGVGCYSWADTLTGTDYPYRATSAAGADDEVTRTQPYGPALATTATGTVSGGTESVTDSVTVSGVPGGANAPTPLSWSLHGPVEAVGGSCPTTAAPYAAAPQVDSGTVPVTGNGTFATPSVNLPGPGCYSYRDSLPGTSDSTPTVVDFGDPAETTLVTAPTLATATSSAEVTSGDAVSDTLTAGGLGTGSGTIGWSLVGPVAPVSDSCTAVDWSGAATVDNGTVQITDGSFAPDFVGPVQVTAVGCYSWVETVTGDTFPGSVSLPAGTTGEVTRVVAYQPVITTTATPTINADGSQTSADRISVSGIPAGAPSSTLTWTLYGPATADPDGTCPTAAASYTSAGAVDTGDITVTGDGDYNTPSTTLARAGCYSYGSSLAATDNGAAVTQAPGDPTETVQPLAPRLTTRTSQTSIAPADPITDAVTITGTHGGSGTLTWSLVGPVAAQGGSCAAVDWATAATAAKGAKAVDGDGVVTVGPVRPDATGCYSWVESLSGTFPSSVTSTAGTAGEVVLVTDTSGVAGQSGHRGSSSGASNSSPTGSGAAGLAATGTDVGELLGLALLAMLTGVGLLLGGRRRRTS